MLDILHSSKQGESKLVSPTDELLQSISRRLILTVGSLYLLFVFASAVWPDQLAVNIWAMLPFVLIVCSVSLVLLPTHFSTGQLIFCIGFYGIVMLGVALFQDPNISLLLVLCPLMATVTLGWPSGIFMEGLVILSALWLYQNGGTLSQSLSFCLMIVMGGVISGSAGWATTQALSTVTKWYILSYREARDKMEMARDRLLELKQIQEDSDKINQELARLSDRLKLMYQVAEEARRAKEEFVANVSHELRTPLNMIIGFSEMIIESPEIYGDDIPSALLSDIAAIHQNSQNLAGLVDDVLDLSQVEAGRMALSKEWTSLPTIVSEATEAVRALFESKGLHLETGFQPDLPPVFCDNTRIRQVVLNLLSNASRFTEHGGVQISARQSKNEIIVSVTDTGPGVAPEDQDKVFEPFQQLDNSIRRRHGGSGLGLSISKQFVEMHRGKMWLESEVGVGTTFYFSLPLLTPSPLMANGDGSALRWFNPYEDFAFRVRTRKSKATPPSVVPRFVILEKGATLWRLFQRYFVNLETIVVNDMEKALQELGEAPAQALIVNSPPNGDGLMSESQLRNLPYRTPALTCWVPGNDDAARQLGAEHYLIKPIKRRTLFSLLERIGPDVKTILLVDDQPDALRLFGRMLAASEQSYRVLRARNGQRALSLLRQRRPDVMLLDLIMPGMDGFQVLREKSQDPTIRDIPVIIITSRDPSGEPMVCDTLAISRSGGLSVRDLLECIQTITEVLNPSAQSGDREPPGKCFV